MWKAILAAAAAVGLLSACGDDAKAKAKATPPAAQSAPAAQPAAVAPAQAAPVQPAPAAEERKETAEANAADKDKLPGEQNQ